MRRQACRRLSVIAVASISLLSFDMPQEQPRTFGWQGGSADGGSAFAPCKTATPRRDSSDMLGMDMDMDMDMDIELPLSIDVGARCSGFLCVLCVPKHLGLTFATLASLAVKDERVNSD